MASSDEPWPFPRVDTLPTYGFLVTDGVKAKVAATGAKIIDLGLGNPDKPTPDAIVAQLAEAAKVGKNHRYHPGRGLPELRRATASWYERRYGARFDPEREVLVTMGAKEGISHLCFALLAKGDVALAPDPAYPIHRAAPMIADAEVETYPSDGDGEPADAVAAALKRVRDSGRRTKLVIANYPQNPTGAVITKEQLAALVKVVRDDGALLLHDLAYADLDFSERYAPSIFSCGVDPDEVKRFAVEIFSMSKSYNMPGWRIGLMAGNERMIAGLSHLKAYLDYGTFMPIQHAAAWALEHGDDIVEGIRSMYKERADALCAGLHDAGWGDVPSPRGTMFVWTPLPKAWSGLTSLEATTRLIERAHVAAAPGDGFGPGGEGWVRFALIEDPPRIAEACKRIAGVLG